MRPAEPDDDPFLYQLYGTTREDLAYIDAPPEQIEKFLQMQFAAQSQHYKAYFPFSENLVIVHEDRPIGRLIVYRTEQEHHFIDIGLLPEFRSRGIGTALITGLIEECRAAGKPARFHVEKLNHRAMKLYQRLGFVFTGEIPTHYEMGLDPRQPDADASSQEAEPGADSQVKTD